MSTMSTKGLDRFIESFEIRDDNVHVTFDQRKIAVQGSSTISIYEPVRKFAFQLEWFPGEPKGHFGVDFYVKDYDHKLDMLAHAFDVGLEYMEDSKQLWVFGETAEAVIRAIMHPMFPQKAVPNFDPLEDRNEYT